MSTTAMTTIKDLNNNVYSVQLSMEYKQADLDLMSDFGEPVIDVGGSFTGPPAYTLPSNERKIKSQFPVSQVFDGNADVNAKDKANVWASEVQSRMSAALATLRLNLDDFTSTTVDTL